MRREYEKRFEGKECLVATCNKERKAFRAFCGKHAEAYLDHTRALDVADLYQPDFEVWVKAQEEKERR